MKKREFHDEEEKKLITAYEGGEFKPVKDQKTEKRLAVTAARRRHKTAAEHHEEEQ